MRAFLLSLSLLSAAAGAADFTTAQVLDVQSKQDFSTSINLLGPGEVQADHYTEVTLQLAAMKVTARTYKMGGGVVWMASHPEAFIVGDTVQARLASRGVLEVQTAAGKKLKLDVLRMEKVTP